MALEVFVGWDPRELDAYEVCEHSLASRATCEIHIQPVILDDLRNEGLYTRKTEIRDGRLWDTTSEAPMSTEFAISRFFVPLLARRMGKTGWALFCDCDFLWLKDIADLTKQFDARKALCCVQHNYQAVEGTKMDGQVQQNYARKNWSSLMAFNLAHPSNGKLDLQLLNSVPGRDLHRFCWLSDDEIGSLSPDWNWLEGTYKVSELAPSAVHFTRGGPWMDGWTDVDFADNWIAEKRSLPVTRGEDVAS